MSKLKFKDNQGNWLELATNSEVTTEIASSLNDYYTKDKIDIELDKKANDSDLTEHIENSDIHVTATDKSNWDNAIQTIKIDGATQIKTNGVVNLPAYPTSLPASNVTDTYSSTGNSPVSGKAVADALSKLDVNTIGGDDKYIKAISETDGKISATVSTLNKEAIGLGNIENKSSETIRSEITSSNVITALGYTPLDSALKGATSGLAELDSDGKVPSTQLPSYVDDVIEVATYSALPTTGESGKIYVTLDTNKTYRWGGSTYVVIGSSLALGETSSTAYRGDYGKIAHDHAIDSNRLTTAKSSGLYKIATTSEGHIASVSDVIKSDITALGIPSQDTTYNEATTSTSGLMSALDKTKLNSVSDNAEANVQSDWNQTDNTKDDFIKNKPVLATVATSGSYNDLTDVPVIPGGTVTAVKINGSTKTPVSGVIDIGTVITDVSDKQDVIEDLEDIREGAEKGATSYQKPTTGIVKTDLASAVQTSLNKADSSVQTIQINGTTQTKTDGVVNLPAYPTSLPSSDVTDLYSPTGHTPISGTAVNSAISALNVSSVGGDGKYIKVISESNGKISATESTLDKSVIDLGNVENKSSETIRSEITSTNVITALGYTPINSTLKGANNGLAELGSDGKIPTSQLPSYVDDVIEVATYSALPTIGESGKIYVVKDTNLTYRWGGSEYVEISASLALGTTSETAFRGDYGNAAYTHSSDSSKLTTAKPSGLYKIATTSQGHIASVTAIKKSDITNLGIPGTDTNTTYTFTGGTNKFTVTPLGGSAQDINITPSIANATTSSNGLMSSTDKTKLNGIAENANNYVHPTYTSKTSGLYKITVDGTGHISNATAVAKTDITALGIPAQDTTYSPATISANGLMSSADKTKLDNIPDDSIETEAIDIVTTISSTSTDNQIPTAKAVQNVLGTIDLSSREAVANKVTSISSSSTDTQYPSAKAVYNAINAAIYDAINAKY